MFIIGGGELAKHITRIASDIQDRVANDMSGISHYLDLSTEVKRLNGEIGKLEITKSQITEKYDKREREIEHKLGLERQRQEQELKLAIREQTVELREKNLEIDRKRFSEQMEFVTKRFTEETGYLKDMIKPLLEALPKMTIKQSV